MSDMDHVLAVLDRLETRQIGFDERFTGLEERFTGLEERFTGLEERFTGLEERFTGLEERFTGLETAHKGLSEHVDRLRGDMMARMDRLQGSMDAVRGDVAVNFDNTERVERQARGTQEQLDKLVEMFGTMFRKIHAIESRLQALEDPKG
jgi:chromosome segregation ATPase